MADIILHPAVLTRPDWLEAMDTIEAQCGRVVIGEGTYAEIDIHHITAEVKA
jgi:hypothetical protein